MAKVIKFEIYGRVNAWRRRPRPRSCVAVQTPHQTAHYAPEQDSGGHEPGKCRQPINANGKNEVPELIINIAVPASAKAVQDSSIDIVDVVPPEQQTTINLRLPDPAFARKLRVFLEYGGERRELVTRITPASHERTMARLIASALNTHEHFAAELDGFEQRLLGLMIVGDDCLLSTEHLSRMLEVFYADFEAVDVESAIEELRRKMAAARVPVSILGEAESGYRLQG